MDTDWEKELEGNRGLEDTEDIVGVHIGGEEMNTVEGNSGDTVGNIEDLEEGSVGKE